MFIILGSTRQNRAGEDVFNWVSDVSKGRDGYEYEKIDLADWDLPFIDDPIPPMAGKYGKDASRWAEKIRDGDGFLIVTPEYNHGYPAALKNAFDLIHKEWNYKPIGFVSYGATSGGIRAVEQLRGVAIELSMVPIHHEVNIPYIWEAFDENGLPKDSKLEDKVLGTVDQLEKWVDVMKKVRDEKVFG